VVAVTQALASAWQVAPKLIHTYEIPQAIPIAPHHVSSLAGTGNASALEEREELRQQILKHHEAAVQAFSERLNLPPGAIDLHEGHPGDVLPAIARRFDASLLVVGVKNRGFWERLASPVAAEPVLANTPCDVLFVRHNAENSAADKSPPGMIKGAPEFDLERAITSPADVFADPGEVLQLEAVGPALKRRILQTWRLDLHMFITDQNEGGLNSEPYLQQLEQVNHSLKQLSTSSDSPERRSSHG
jgi:nucleotide-binding universal stress UspA family protein